MKIMRDIIRDMLLTILILGVLVYLSQAALADTLIHKFKSPSFSGINTSSHYLTIENQEHIRNLESRVYAQLSRQMVDNLFGETPKTEGTIELEGNTISYSSNGELITLTVVDSDGTTTDISLPIGSFTF